MALNTFLYKVDRPTLQHFQGYITALNAHYMQKLCRSPGRVAGKMWLKAECKIAKQMYLKWRKRQLRCETGRPIVKRAVDLSKRIKLRRRLRRKCGPAELVEDDPMEEAFAPFALSVRAPPLFSS